MLILAATTDKIDLVSGQAGTLDVHASWVDYAAGTITPGKTNTAITTATTTDLVAAPAASTQRNVKYVNIRNKHATVSVDVTPRFNQNGTAFELQKFTLAPGDCLEFVEGVGWFKIPNPVNVPGPNVATADQAIGASVTSYITNSDLHVVAGRPLKVGTVIRWHIGFSKTAAATASMTFDLRVGTAGTTGDTSRGSLATGAQTGIVDQGEIEIAATIRSISATGTLHFKAEMEHNFAATGFAPTNPVTAQSTSGTFDTTATNLIFGVSLTTGALHAITVQHVVAEFVAGTI